MSSSEYTPVDWPFVVALSSVVWQSWDLGHLLVVWCITGRWCRQQTNSTSGWSPPLALSNTFRVCEIFPVVCGAASFHGPKNSLQSVMNPTRAQLHWFNSSFLLNHLIATHRQILTRSPLETDGSVNWCGWVDNPKSTRDRFLLFIVAGPDQN